MGKPFKYTLMLVLQTMPEKYVEHPLLFYNHDATKHMTRKFRGHNKHVV